FGIGCNPGITRHMKNTLFDEKMAGTVHLAIGTSFPQLGGTNTSAVHWDMVKELRNGGRIELDGEVVQENGRWLTWTRGSPTTPAFSSSAVSASSQDGRC